jgi:hypothetical protein
VHAARHSLRFHSVHLVVSWTLCLPACWQDSRWYGQSLTLHQLREKSGWQKAAVAMANKNARILWAMMTKGCRFDAQHVSVKPAGLAHAMA